MKTECTCLGAAWWNLQTQVRTVFSSSGIGIENFQRAREQHVKRFAPSLGTNFN